MAENFRSPSLWRKQQAEALVAQAHSQGGLMALVAGLPGMGKTYFLREITNAAHRDSTWAVHYANADQVEAGEPYTFIERLLASGITSRPTFLPEDLTQPIPVARRLLQEFFHDGAPPGRVLVIDDAQWIDTKSTQVLRYLIPRLIRRNVLLALSIRTPHEPGSFGEFLSHSAANSPLDTVVHLEPLTLNQIHELALERLGVGISPRVAARLLESTSGSFLGVRSVLDHLTPDEVARIHLTWDIPIRGLDHTDSPLLTSYEQLSEPARATTEIVCLAGHELSHAELAEVARILGEKVHTKEAIAGGVLSESGFGATLIPTHALIGHAIRSAVAPQRAQPVYQALAQVTTGFRSIRHALAGAQTWDEDLAAKVDDYLRTATEQGALGNVNEVLETALELAQSAQDREQLLIDLALVHFRNLSGYQLLPRTAEYEALPPSMLRELIGVMLAAHRVEEEFPYHRVKAIFATETTDPDERTMQAFLAFMTVIMTMRSRKVELLAELIPQAIKLFALAPTDPNELNNPHLRWMATPQAFSTLLECYGLVALHQSDQIEAAQGLLTTLLPKVQQMPDSQIKADALVALAGAQVTLGDVKSAFALASQCVSLMDRVPPPWSGGSARIIYAHTAKLLGKHQESLQMITLIEEVAFEVLDIEVRAQLSALQAMLTAIGGTGDPNPALHAAQRLNELEWESYGPDLAIIAACEVARATGDNHQILAVTAPANVHRFRATRRGFLTFRAHALLNVGRDDDAQVLIDQLAQMRGRLWHEFWGSLEWLQARQAAIRGDAVMADELFGIAITKRDFPLPLALTLIDYARFLIRLNRSDDAAERLQAAIRILNSLEAATYEKQAEDLLSKITAAGLSDRDELLNRLTAREREITLLMADGKSNQQIADSLVVTLATARFHASNVLRKLEISSRAEVARVLRIRAEPPR